MKGSVFSQENGENKLTIGYAPDSVTNVVISLEVILLLLLGIWTYVELPHTSYRPLVFIGIYLLAALVYSNCGVWLHEQLHCLPFHRPEFTGRLKITYERRFLLLLHGYYQVNGDLSYPVMKRALLGPLWLAALFLMLGLAGNFLLPGWWLPVWLSLALISLCDMIHDIYWLWATRKIGDKGTYQDKGGELEVTWKDSPLY